MWLNDCTPEEQVVLMAITALAADLPRSFHEYAEALTDLNRKFFKQPARALRDHNPSKGSLSLTRKVRAR